MLAVGNDEDAHCCVRLGLPDLRCRASFFCFGGSAVNKQLVEKLRGWADSLILSYTIPPYHCVICGVTDYIWQHEYGKIDGVGQ
jgi:hypothetical protein